MKDAAICSMDNADWFVVTDGSNISQSELAQIVASIGNVDHLAATGIKVGGEKFVFVSGDESTIRGRKKGTGVHCKKTETTLIVGILRRNGSAASSCRRHREDGQLPDQEPLLTSPSNFNRFV